MQGITRVESWRGSFGSLRSTLGVRFWFVAGLGTLAALIALGVPTDIIPNPFFTRMTDPEPFNSAVWLLTALLIGLLIATYVRPTGHNLEHPQGQPGVGRVTVAGVGAYLAIGCPICNKVVVAALGASGALSYFAPLQPAIGAGSVALLAATLIWRLRDRSRGCERCSAPVPS